MSSGIFIIGAGGHAKVVITLLRAMGERAVAIFADDQQAQGKRILDVPVVGRVQDLRAAEFAAGVIAIGSNTTRAAIDAMLRVTWLTAVHPRAYVDPTVRLGAGTVVFAGAVVQPDTVIGRHVIVNTAATVDHDCTIGDFVHLAPGVHLAGGVRVGQGSLVGIGSAAIPGVCVGDNAVIGAGSVVIKDIPDGATAYGNPARVALR